MSNRLANRRSPSGPKSAIELPFVNTAPLAAGATAFVLVGAGVALAAPAPQAQVRIPANGKLDTLLVQNNPVGADAVNATYQARKNGANVGNPVIIANNVAGPIKVDLSSINVLEGDLVDLSVSSIAFGGAAPSARILFTWIPTTSS